MTVLILQARLDSTRLENKAILDFLGKPIIFRVMERLAKVPADAHILACDHDSLEAFEPIAKEAGFRCIAGSKDDVLERFCSCITELKADVVLRATGDNPFIFTDAAALSLKRFAELQRIASADYFTFTGLPYGSGVEVFSAAALLKSRKNASLYEREHVGPALYLHADEFSCFFEKAPVEWSAPRLRTTVDTASDYATALAAADFLLSKGKSFPFDDTDIKGAFEFITRAVVFVPACGPDRGTGHLRRTFAAAIALQDSWNCFILIEGYKKDDAVTARVRGILSSFEDEERSLIESKIIADMDFAAAFEPLNVELHRFVLDNFETGKDEMLELLKLAPVIAIDEGGEGRALADYVFDVIPSILHAPGKKKKKHDAFSSFNVFMPECIPLPKAKTRRADLGDRARILVAAGTLSADKSAEPIAYARAFAAAGFDTTLIAAQVESDFGNRPNLTVARDIPRLAEKLTGFDVVITYYGFTAFEALAAGCRVALFSPSDVHKRVAEAYRFAAMPHISALEDAEAARRFIAALDAAPKPIGACASFASIERKQADYASELSKALAGEALACAFCGHSFSRNDDLSKSIGKTQSFRDERKTIAVCPNCKTHVIRYSVSPKKNYGEQYFFEEYSRQYGKTYLEDFSLIKKSGERRMRIIDAIAAKSGVAVGAVKGTILDVGCAYGPFLAAAAEAGWQPYGTDISGAAVQYVKDKLGFPAVKTPFPECEAAFKAEGFPQAFSAISFWFVIEHFENLAAVFNAARNLLVDGGVLAISTPSCTGISARKDQAAFYSASPDDHYSIWNPRKVRHHLRACGFCVKKIVITGHHPERFPQRLVPKPLKKAYRALCSLVSVLFSLGETFEVYAVKRELKNTEEK